MKSWTITSCASAKRAGNNVRSRKRPSPDEELLIGRFFCEKQTAPQGTLFPPSSGCPSCSAAGATGSASAPHYCFFRCHFVLFDVPPQQLFPPRSPPPSSAPHAAKPKSACRAGISRIGPGILHADIRNRKVLSARLCRFLLCSTSIDFLCALVIMKASHPQVRLSLRMPHSVFSGD